MPTPDYYKYAFDTPTKDAIADVASDLSKVSAKIPKAPTTNGTYVLTCTVTATGAAYSWESAT